MHERVGSSERVSSEHRVLQSNASEHLSLLVELSGLLSRQVDERGVRELTRIAVPVEGARPEPFTPHSTQHTQYKDEAAILWKAFRRCELDDDGYDCLW